MVAHTYRIIMGAGYAGTQLFPFAMLPDTISADTIKTGLRRPGAFTGIWMVGDKGGFAIGPAIFAAVLAITGYINCFFIAQKALLSGRIYGLSLKDYCLFK